MLCNGIYLRLSGAALDGIDAMHAEEHCKVRQTTIDTSIPASLVHLE